MHWRLYVDLLKRSGSAWVADNAPSMGAALAFYSAFSLAPLLIIVIAIASAAYGEDAARGAIVAQLLGKVPEVEMGKDLRRFKQLIETGEVVRTEGQPAGRASGHTWLDSIARY